jgi:uncharacterized protein (DUF697 family)
MVETATVETDVAGAEKIISYYSKWGAGMGLIPVPLVDLAAVTGVQLKMLKRLARNYHVEYDESSGKALIGSLLGAILPAKLGYGGIGSAIKAIPGVGTILGMAAVPAFNYGSTYAVGRVFAKHFAGGGTLLDFDPSSMHGHVISEYKRASEPKSAK